MTEQKKTEINYNTTFSAEVKEQNGRKVVELKGSLMNFNANDNNWSIGEGEKYNIITGVAQSPVKVQHSDSDWEIIGTGIKGVAGNDFIGYVCNITDNKAVEKFESGTWNKDNMGISPCVASEKMKCSICGEEFIFGGYHEHYIGEEYKGNICKYELIGCKLKEMSLTSNPAYKSMGSGNIQDVNSFYASLDKKYEGINKDKLEANNMAEEKEKKNAEKETEEAKNQAEKIKADLEESKAENTELKKEVEKVKAELEKIQGLYAEIQEGVRKHELGDVIKNEEVVAEIISKKLSDTEFAAEIKRYKTIVAEAKNVYGSAPLDKNNSSKTESEIYKAEVEKLTKSVEQNRGEKSE